MSAAWQFYISTVLVYLGVDIIACWGLNLQFGVAGVNNFAFIMYQAAGAYTAAVLTIGPMTPFDFQHYVGGSNWPFPLPLLAAAAVGALLSAVTGPIALNRLRADYQAMVLLVISLIATSVATNDVSLVNGAAGLSLVPKPLQFSLGVSYLQYDWLYAAFTGVVCLMVYWFVHRITAAPFGRSLRAMRENESAAAALGMNVTQLRMTVLIVGGAIAGLSGGVLVQFIGTWAPGSWLYPETFILFTAIIVGGVGNNLGVAFGALLVPVAFLEATRFLPAFGYPGLIDALEWIVVGVLTLVFLWFWPRGIIPERRRRFRAPPRPVDAPPQPVEAPTHSATISIEPQLRRSARTDDVRDELLVVEHVSRSFGGVQAVDDVSFAARRGRITGLIGPNGAGKSTLVSLIAGGVRPTAGHIRVNGEDLAGLPAYAVARRGVIRTFQIPSGFGRMTVLENLVASAPRQFEDTLRCALLGRRAWRKRQDGVVQDALGLLDRFAMTPLKDEYAANLSGGQKNLLELMRVLIARPTLLLLDEPLAGVNPTLAMRLVGYLEQLRDEGHTMLLVEHQMGPVRRLCDEVIVMAQGRVIFHGDATDVGSNADVQEAYLVG